MDWTTLLNSFLEIIIPAAATVIAGCFTVIGAKIKAVYEKNVTNETVQTVISEVVNYVQQVYWESEGSEKLAQATEQATTILNEKGITVSETELRTLIESAVYGLKTGTATNTTVTSGYLSVETDEDSALEYETITTTTTEADETEVTVNEEEAE